MRFRTYLLLAACLLALAAVVLTLALVGTPEVTGWLATTARAALGSSAVGYLLVSATIFFFGSLAARGWEIAKDGARARSVRAELAARAYTVRPANLDTSSLVDDSQGGPLPATWRAPCGEPIALRTCETCGLIVIRDACGQPWPRPHIRSGFHLRCGHGSACHPPAQARATSHNTHTDSGRPAA